MKMIKFCSLIFCLALVPASFSYAAGGDSQTDSILISLILVLFMGRLGADLARRLGQPEVLGELGCGIIMGNIALLGFDGFEFLKHEQTLKILSEIGIILLLFTVGLVTDLSEMIKVGTTALFVAILGVITPMILGIGVAYFFVPEGGFAEHLFIGAVLTATSVGITARVFTELGLLGSSEAKIILGAAVIDDVLGLLVLATVVSLVKSAATGIDLNILDLVLILSKSLLFIGGALFFGRLLLPTFFRLLEHIKSEGSLLVGGIVLCFGFAVLASKAGLAPIIGAFAAGLILEPRHYKNMAEWAEVRQLDALFAPLLSFMVPLFFVMMGLRVDLISMADGSIIAFAIALTIAALVGKQVCGLAVREKEVDKVLVGIGMIPRGEVGLIFAAVGSSLIVGGHQVIGSGTFGAIVFMVLVTTMITPILVKWRISRKTKDAQAR